MGSETKYECGVCRDLRTDDNGNECRACAPPDIPTPPADGEADVRQTLNEVIECCQAAERDALRWLYVLRHGSLGLDEEGELVLAFSFGPADDAPYLSADEVDEVSGNKPNAKGWVRGEVLNRAIDYVRGEHALGLPPAPPCIHERELLALRARPLPDDVRAVVEREAADWSERIAESSASPDAKDAALVSHKRFIARLTDVLAHIQRTEAR